MSEGPERRLAAIVSADVVGYSRMMGVDEEGTLAALRAHRSQLIDPEISEHGGRIVKTMGDGLLLEFASAVDAVRCSLAVQQGMSARNLDISDDKKIIFRIGINFSEIIVEDGDIFGDGVNVTARLEGMAIRKMIFLSSEMSSFRDVPKPYSNPGANHAAPSTAILVGLVGQWQLRPR